MSATSDRCRDRPFVLFADDDPHILAMLVVAAEHRGWCADTATSARQILDKVNAHCGERGTCYDAIVADVNYFAQPGEEEDAGQYRMTGITAAHRIKEKYRDLPIVFISAFGSTLMRDEARSVSEDFFDKPFDPMKLLDRVGELVEFTTRALGGPGHRTATGDLKAPRVVEEVQALIRQMNEDTKARRAS